MQITGLAGKDGILPAQDFLRVAHEQTGLSAYFWFPTLFWLHLSDTMLTLACYAGALFSVLLILNVAPRLMLILLYIFYLSLCTAGMDFLQFQWDYLLLETGFIAIFFAPRKLFSHGTNNDDAPSKYARWLLYWLLFRLMFGSGIVKLLSGDVSWRNLTALTFHYETQPLPTWLGWYAHQLPVWFHKFSCALMFLIEFVVPFFIFGARPLKIAAFFLFLFLQTLIGLTGNYTFFNLLSVAPCILLLDDTFLEKILPKIFLQRCEPPHEHVLPEKNYFMAVTAAFLFLLSLLSFSGSLLRREGVSMPLVNLRRIISTYRIANSYGLFSVMTNPRYEIIVEGSDDGKTWLAYEFKYKPGDMKQKPQFVEPHQPRLDWQMWFAALSTCEQTFWFRRFLVQLLHGSPSVLRLLKTNPFPGEPPRYLRSTLYEYHFTDMATRGKTGAWWTRTFRGLYCPVLQSEGNGVMPAVQQSI